MKTIINKESGKVLFATLNDNHISLDGELAIDNILTQSFISPYFNQTTNEFYEGATPQEIEQSNKQEVPNEVPLWAMRNILRKKNLFNVIIETINQLDEPLKTDALDYLEYGNFVERNSNAVLLIQQTTQMTNDEVDDLFIEANSLKL